MKVELSCGFVLEADESLGDDQEFMDMVICVDSGEMKYYPLIVQKLIGDKQKKDLYEHLRKDGKVSAKAFNAALYETIQAVMPKK